MYSKKKKRKNLITDGEKKHCRKCKGDINRSKWPVTVHDSGALLEPPTPTQE